MPRRPSRSRRTLAEAHAALVGCAFVRSGNFPKGVAELSRAKELSPANPTANDLLARVIGLLGRDDEAEGKRGRRVELDPLFLFSAE